ncbi:MAG TPA: hydrogenase nickel incorporation protein HypB [Dehalococcoidia bacterium]|nr:hydrogenase nickel incorporation protein HypB [Dehalococcoidia bacterium]
MEIKVLKDILGANEQIAKQNRQLLDKNSVFAANVMSSPGAGKTSLILETIKRLKGETRIGVIEGDVSSSIDAETIGSENVPVLQINTGGECHLDANMTQRALDSMQLQDIELLFIENVGNLICTAEFAIGAHKNLVIASTPEGDDKPLKYPLMFTVADVVLINKIDLLPHLQFDTMAYKKAVKNLNDRAEIFEVSCTTGQGVDRWLAWLRNQMRLFKNPKNR